MKNIFIFAPLFFAGEIFQQDLFLNSIVAFIAFSLIASGVYIYNDIQDVNEDRLHFKKKFRPIASGKISIRKARMYQIALILTSVFISLTFLPLMALWTMLIYVLINVIYSKILKHYALYDIVIIATGFVIRLFIGGIVTGIALSHWIVIITFFLALFLAASKRRAESVSHKTKNIYTRKAIDGYNVELIDIILGITATISIISYIMYAVFGTHLGSNLYLTTVFVLLGFFRFTQILIVEDEGHEPTKVLIKDRQMYIIVTLWALSFGVFIYG